ncbi:uncharacterized protein LOC110840746 [Zootermopsis nevadensis]|uniref:uncharacterized protein LOC110840746 n=1 Tax=Zootermopsis nevadensis TaxID=136037 RepID=UPI000B8E5ED0|nr:uncharacterized protein LOC110840746 [Zootermopsis nevadensis]
MDNELFIIKLPFQSYSCPTCLRSGRGSYVALSLSDIIFHHKDKHSALQLNFQCAKCDKLYQRKHSALCHLVKCTALKTVLPYKCHLCEDSFGLSQHKRHLHPLARNAERLASVPMPRTPPSSAGRVFSREDIEAMLQLEVILRGDARIAMKMAAQLKSKTAKQIRDKRREPIYIAKRNALLKKTAPTDPGPSMASPSGEQGGITTVETPKDVYEQANALELEPASDMQGECTQPRDVQTSAALPENNRNTTQDGNSKWESEITQPGDWNPPAGHPTTIIPIMGSQDDIARGGGSELELGTDQSEITQPGDWNPPAGHPTTIIPIMGSQDDIARGGSSELELGTDQLCDCIPSADHINEYEDTDNIWRESLRESLLELGGDRFSKDAAELVGNIKKSVVAGNLSQEVINETYSAVLDFLRPKHTSSSTTSQSCPKHSKTKGKKRKRALKRFKYAITQNLFKKNPALLAKQVRMGTDLSAQNGAQLPREEVEHLYNILWSTTPSLRLPDYVETPDPISLDLFLGELKQEEVYKRLGKMKRSTAAGPDGIKPDALGNKVSRRVLCALYNLILLSGHLPYQQMFLAFNYTTKMADEIFVLKN